MSVTKSIGVAALAERDHLLEDAPVRVAEEIARVDDLGGLVERVVVDQDRAEHGLLGFEVVRKRALARRRQACARGQRDVREDDQSLLGRHEPWSALSATTLTRTARHVAVELDRHGELAERLERIGSWILRLSTSKPLAASASRDVGRR